MTYPSTVVKATLHRTASIFSLFNPAHDLKDQDKLENLIKQLPKPFILLGDINSENTIWGPNEINKKENMTERFIMHNDLCLLKPKYTETWFGWKTL